MFKFLKEKLTKAVSIFSKKVKEETEEVKEKVEKPKKEKKLKEKIEKKSVKKEEKPAKVEEKEPEEVKEAESEPEEEEKQGFFSKLLKKKEPEEKEKVKKPGLLTTGLLKLSLSEKKFDELFWNLELILLDNNVAVEVIEKFKQDLKDELLSKKISPFKVDVLIKETLKKSVEDIFDIEEINIFSKIKKEKPYIILFVGVNGSGKTTTLAKLAHLLKKKGLKSVIAACDTFRAAALHQLEEHCNNLDVKLIKHDYGSDAAAVAFDAIKHAKAKNLDVVLIDTAGRSHSNVNLMDELKKVNRVSNPNLTIFVGDSLTGNDAVEQARAFNESIGIDAVILTKVDVDEKGGAAISIGYVTGKPIIYIGAGQEYKDLKEFDKNSIIDSIGLN
ncbi:signal recognition particle-docking protein FtsY [Candidatus Woesearchaeota archaeon]|jgi:fused signal recognition particle receptor|nr:signal recognition particle-docking protein FtsY [Candidatus Woesearchaeota archaeon]